MHLTTTIEISSMENSSFGDGNQHSQESQVSGFAEDCRYEFESVTKRRRSSSVVRVTHPHSTSDDELSDGIELNVNARSEEVEKLCHATSCEDGM